MRQQFILCKFPKGTRVEAIGSAIAPALAAGPLALKPEQTAGSSRLLFSGSKKPSLLSVDQNRAVVDIREDPSNESTAVIRIFGKSEPVSSSTLFGMTYGEYPLGAEQVAVAATSLSASLTTTFKTRVECAVFDQGTLAGTARQVLR
jgi:hypothetical protein